MAVLLRIQTHHHDSFTIGGPPSVSSGFDEMSSGDFFTVTNWTGVLLLRKVVRVVQDNKANIILLAKVAGSIKFRRRVSP
jgi:hypothetical protein